MFLKRCTQLYISSISRWFSHTSYNDLCSLCSQNLHTITSASGSAVWWRAQKGTMLPSGSAVTRTVDVKRTRVWRVCSLNPPYKNANICSPCESGVHCRSKRKKRLHGIQNKSFLWSLYASSEILLDCHVDSRVVFPTAHGTRRQHETAVFLLWFVHVRRVHSGATRKSVCTVCTPHKRGQKRSICAYIMGKNQRLLRCNHTPCDYHEHSCNHET